MINFLLLMVIPVLISMAVLIYFKGHMDTILDFAIQIGIVGLVVAGGLGLTYFDRTVDREVWNGQITSKVRQQVGCRHSYECNCVYINKVLVCQTCYEHSFDVDWELHTSTSEETDIDTIDRQGLIMPPRWGAAFIGEPYSSEHTYTNYILANPDSVLLGQKGDLKKFGPLIPQYPKVYDYYKMDHVINMGVPIATAQFNWLVNEMDKKLGPIKQVNVLVVLVHTDDPDYVYAFRDAWKGGKKNDAIVLIGSIDGNKIDWADVVSWETNPAYSVSLKDKIMEIGYLNRRDEIAVAISETTQGQFQRMHMENYKWLVRSYQPSQKVMIWMFILATLASIGSCIGSVTYHEGMWGNAEYDYNKSYRTRRYQ